MDKVKLYINDEEFVEVSLKRPTMALKDTLLLLNLEFTQKHKAITESDKYSKIPEIQNILIEIESGEQNTAKALTLLNNPSNSTILQEYVTEIQRLTDEYNLKRFKAIINTNDLDDETKQKLNQPTNSAFWKQQDYEEVQKAIDYFRRKFGI